MKAWENEGINEIIGEWTDVEITEAMKQAVVQLERGE